MTTPLDKLWLPYAQMKTAPLPIAVRSISGTRITLTDGRELVDGIASWWTAVHGYNHPAIIAAVREQLESVPHIMLGGLVHEQTVRLAQRLTEMLPGDMAPGYWAPGYWAKVFFTESGSVAVEVALKIAVQYWRNTTGQVRPRFLAFRGGYHGDTFAAMSVCDPDDSMHALFGPALARQVIVDLPTDEASAARMDQALDQNTDIAAVIVEPLLQGAAGMRMHDAATLRRIREICDRHGVLLILDEIFTGFGRLGTMFAAEQAGIAADIVTLGKALTGGVAPLAATVASRKVYDAFHSADASKALMHGPTFTGHALGCAAANASLDLFESEPRLEQVRGIERALSAALEPARSLPGVAGVRVKGAVGAVEMAEPFNLDRWRSRFIERGVFIRPLGKVIYLTPAYVISPDDLSTLTEALLGALPDIPE